MVGSGGEVGEGQNTEDSAYLDEVGGSGGSGTNDLIDHDRSSSSGRGV